MSLTRGACETLWGVEKPWGSWGVCLTTQVELSGASSWSQEAQLC